MQAHRPSVGSALVMTLLVITGLVPVIPMEEAQRSPA
jgi:hypothetical protein